MSFTKLFQYFTILIIGLSATTHALAAGFLEISITPSESGDGRFQVIVIQMYDSANEKPVVFEMDQNGSAVVSLNADLNRPIGESDTNNGVNSQISIKSYSLDVLKPGTVFLYKNYFKNLPDSFKTDIAKRENLSPEVLYKIIRTK